MDTERALQESPGQSAQQEALAFVEVHVLRMYKGFFLLGVCFSMWLAAFAERMVPAGGAIGCVAAAAAALIQLACAVVWGWLHLEPWVRWALHGPHGRARVGQMTPPCKPSERLRRVRDTLSRDLAIGGAKGLVVLTCGALLFMAIGRAVALHGSSTPDGVGSMTWWLPVSAFLTGPVIAWYAVLSPRLWARHRLGVAWHVRLRSWSPLHLYLPRDDPARCSDPGGRAREENDDR